MKTKGYFALAGLLILALISACQPAWAIIIESERGNVLFARSDFEKYKKEFTNTEICPGLPLNYILYRSSIEVVESATFKDTAGNKEELDWQKSGEKVCLDEKGKISLGNRKLPSNSIKIDEAPAGDELFSILDIAPTVLSALGIGYENLPGKTLIEGQFDHVALIFLDGFGYIKYHQALENGLLKNLSQGVAAEKAVTVYPPRTSVASAAILTGLPPTENGIYETGIRKTEAATIFDLTSSSGLKSIAVEGESLAFNLRNTEVILSGDRDLNGSTDDNVFSNAEDVIKTNMPDLLWIHFHGIDDSGHSFGPDSEQVNRKIIEIDSYYGKIIHMLPENTLIIAFADHGMHLVNEEGRVGNHGNLIYDDMVIPVFVETK